MTPFRLRGKLFWKLFAINFGGMAFVLLLFTLVSILFLRFNFERYRENHFRILKTEIASAVRRMLDEKTLDENFPDHGKKHEIVRETLVRSLERLNRFPAGIIDVAVQKTSLLNHRGEFLFGGFLDARPPRERFGNHRKNGGNGQFPRRPGPEAFGRHDRIAKAERRIRELFEDFQEEFEEEREEFAEEREEGQAFLFRSDETRRERDALPFPFGFSASEHGGFERGGWFVLSGTSGRPVFLHFDERHFFHYLAGGERFVRNQQIGILWVVLASVLVAFGLTFLANRFFMKRMAAIDEGLKAVENQNFGVRIPVTSDDELGGLAKKFNAMAASIENFDAGRQRWIGEISHELNTPLAIVKGEIEALIDGVRPPTKANLASILEEIDRLGKLTRDLKTLSLTDSDNLWMEFERVNAVPFLENLLKSHRSRFEKARLTLEKDFAVPEKQTVEIDSNRISQVFRNLFENCLRYSLSPGRVFVSARLENDRLVVSIADEGPGCQGSDPEKLFERFYTADPSRSRASGGTGLGLAVCRNLVKLHQGEILARQTVAGGLEIVVKLPLRHDPR